MKNTCLKNLLEKNNIQGHCFVIIRNTIKYIFPLEIYSAYCELEKAKLKSKSVQTYSKKPFSCKTN